MSSTMIELKKHTIIVPVTDQRTHLIPGTLMTQVLRKKDEGSQVKLLLRFAMSHFLGLIKLIVETHVTLWFKPRVWGFQLKLLFRKCQ